LLYETASGENLQEISDLKPPRVFILLEAFVFLAGDIFPRKFLIAPFGGYL
jgi:hypothetical protein